MDSNDSSNLHKLYASNIAGRIKAESMDKLYRRASYLRYFTNPKYKKGTPPPEWDCEFGVGDWHPDNWAPKNPQSPELKVELAVIHDELIRRSNSELDRYRDERIEDRNAELNRVRDEQALLSNRVLKILKEGERKQGKKGHHEIPAMHISQSINAPPFQQLVQHTAVQLGGVPSMAKRVGYNRKVKPTDAVADLADGRFLHPDPTINIHGIISAYDHSTYGTETTEPSDRDEARRNHWTNLLEKTASTGFIKG